MQPTLTQVPPSAAASASATRAPRCAAMRAARTPPLPPPMTNRSKSKEGDGVGAGVAEAVMGAGEWRGKPEGEGNQLESGPPPGIPARDDFDGDMLAGASRSPPRRRFARHT